MSSFKVSWTSQSVGDRGIALVRKQIVNAWRLRQDNTLVSSSVAHRPSSSSLCWHQNLSFHE